MFSDTGKQLASSLDYEVTLRTVARLAVPTLAGGCIVAIVQDDGSISGLATAHVDPAREQALAELARDCLSALDVAAVLLTGRSALRQFKSDSALIVPLVAREQTL